MLRFDDCVCGTSTTGTGTLTLAATPTGIGGIDPDVWARSSLFSFGNSAAILVDYVITEYTDSTFAAEKSKEKGTGTLSLGGSAGIANCSLARTTVAWSATALNTQPAVIGTTAFSIGTAANVLVTVSPSAFAVPGFHPYFETALGDTNWGANPDGATPNTGNTSAWPTSNTDWYMPFRWSVPMLVKRLSFRITTYTSPTGSFALFIRIYDFGTNGRPGKLLYDFTPSSGLTSATLTGTGTFSTGATSPGIYLPPGDYLADFALTGLTGGTINFRAPAVASQTNPAQSRFAASTGNGQTLATAASATAGAGPDPANVTTYALTANSPVQFGLNNA